MSRNRLRRTLLRCRALALVALAALPLQAQKLAPVSKDTTTVVYDDDGLRIRSNDGRRQLKIRGFVDFDARVVMSDTNDAAPNSLSMHRARIVFDANVNPVVAFRMAVDVLTVGAAPIVDAFADVTLSPHWWIRVGKQKTPYGLERYTSISEHLFPERSIATALTSSRDGGVLLTGEYGDGRYAGSIGVFNGIPDGAIGDADVNDAKDVALRLAYRPVMLNGGQGLLVGYNGTSGIQRGTSGNSQLPKFLTLTGLPFFSYLESAGAIADGLRTRNGLFTDAHVGHWGVTAEWYQNAARVRRGTSVGDVTTGGWLGGLDYVLSGERSVHGAVSPAQPFDPSKGHWGALQAVARAARVTVSSEAFPLYADSTVAARRATELGAGLNWFLSRTTKLHLDFEQTAFVGGAPTGDRKTEQMGLLRMQVYF